MALPTRSSSSHAGPSTAPQPPQTSTAAARQTELEEKISQKRAELSGLEKELEAHRQVHNLPDSNNNKKHKASTNPPTSPPCNIPADNGRPARQDKHERRNKPGAWDPTGHEDDDDDDDDWRHFLLPRLRSYSYVFLNALHRLNRRQTAYFGIEKVLRELRADARKDRRPLSADNFTDEQRAALEALRTAIEADYRAISVLARTERQDLEPIRGVLEDMAKRVVAAAKEK